MAAASAGDGGREGKRGDWPMVGANSSCLIDKLSHYVELDDISRSHLATLEEEEQEIARHEDVVQSGGCSPHLFVIRRGWLYSYADMPDGRRQIVKIHYPGDVVGFADVAFEHATVTLRAAENACLCPFPKQRLDVIFRDSPKLTALLFTLAVRDQVILIDLVRAMGRMSARERLAYLLLDAVSRLRLTNRGMTDTFRMPLNQGEIGDLLGLTNVYVSKTFSALEKEGYIARGEGTVTLLRERELAEMCDFFNRYQDMDTSWFPGA